MKAPAFTYHDPRSLADLKGLLGTLEIVRLLAGGQSLMPMLNMRLTTPDHLIDLNRIDALAGIELREGKLAIGAMTRQCDLEASPLVRAHCPLLTEALSHVGHRQTRNRGTFGGSLCHLDPSAELPLVAAVIDATIQIESNRGRRELPMASFPVGYLTSALEPDELMTGALLPAWPVGHGYAFVEFARRHGDFAVVAVAVLMTVDGGGRIARVAIAIGGVGLGPVRVSAAETLLTGATGAPERFDAAADLAGEIESNGDIHASPAYRQHLARVLTERALVVAYQRAGN